MPGVHSRKRCFDKPEPDLDIPISTNVFEEGLQSTTGIKAGWCLREGMPHILKANGSALATIHRQEGEPQDIPQFKGVQNCFQSLCQIVTGQQLTSRSALNIWERFVATTNKNVTPSKVLELAKMGVKDNLQEPSGLSKAKARTIVLLSEAFSSGDLTESFLTSSSDDEVRKALIKIWGIADWSCDMFLMNYLERPDVFPIGDLGVRKGIAKLFSLRGKGEKGSLSNKNKKDIEVMERMMQPFKPYRSIATYYMWKIANSKDAYEKDSKKQKTEVTRIEPNKGEEFVKQESL